MSLNAVHRRWQFNAPLHQLCLNRRGDYVAAALGDGSVQLFEANDLVEATKSLQIHNGISLCLAADADDHAFLSGGDDGQLLLIDPQLEVPTLLANHPHQWIDQAAGNVNGTRAYSIGKKLYLLDDAGEPIGNPQMLPSSPGALSFSPNGKRLAVSHYNGVSLFWVNAKEQTPTLLPWKGSHLGLCWHPDSKIVMTAMQEPALHGWRVDMAGSKTPNERSEMQMQGYAAKIRSMGFTAKGKYLVTSGAEQAICWPFFGGGPWGKAPMLLGGSDARLVTQVAAHPTDELVAVGYEDGMIVLAPLNGQMEIMIYPPTSDKAATVTGLVWNAAGDCLFAGLANGTLLLFTLKSVGQAVRR